MFNGNPEDVRNVMSKLFTYTKERIDSQGNIVRTQEPLHIFSMLLPKKQTFFNIRTGRTENTMLYVPKGRFAEKSDKNGIYSNNNYDHSNPNSEQPKRSYYDNSEAF